MKIVISVDCARTLVMHEQALFHAAVENSDTHAAWRSLERIHILSQEFGLIHLASHLEDVVLCMVVEGYQGGVGSADTACIGANWQHHW